MTTFGYFANMFAMKGTLSMNKQNTKIKVSIAYFVGSVEIDFDTSRINDKDYLEQKRNEAKALADKYLEASPPTSVVIDSDIPELNE